jgi:selenocysteine-specific elongation factor
MILQAIEKLGVASPVELAEQNKIPLIQIQELVQELIMGKKIIQLNAKNIPETERLLVSFQTLDGILQQIKKEFDLYYIKKPLRLGMKKEELRSRIPFTQHITEYLLYYFLEQRSLFANKNLICWPTHNIQFTPEQKRFVQNLLNQFKTHPFNPPLVTECMEIVGKDVFQALLDLEELIQVSPEVVFWKPTYEEMIVIIKDLIKTRGSLTLAEVRDSFKTSRRFALAILEHLDRLEITERDGDSRKLKK